jgi:hypothetical protein
MTQILNEQFVFFWGGPFSQWHLSKFNIDGIEYNCCEQYMMAEKVRMFNDNISLKEIMKSSNPKEQKKIGREVKGFIVDDWEKVARDIVYKGNWAKFTQNKKLKDILIQTKGKTLVEASPYDKIWGIGLDEKDPRALDKEKWLGKNWLGEVLTKVREDIINENQRKGFE